MNKARKALEELIKNIDIVIELLDARAPFSSCNPLIQNIIKHKKIIRLLNKSDLADSVTTKIWLDFFSSKANTIAIESYKDNLKQKNKLIKLCQNLCPNRNSFEKPLRVMITGIPNVGKSTLINQLLGRYVAKTGDIPAVTKANQRLTLRDDFLIYDTPGVTWEKFAYVETGYNLAICNSIGKNACDEELIALYLIDYLKTHYPESIVKRYKTPSLELSCVEIIDYIARQRGCILRHNELDRQRAYEIIIQDFRDGILGKISLETPEIWANIVTN